MTIEVPAMDGEKLRQVGVSHGLVHALVALKLDIDHRVYNPIPSHHARRIREREMQVAPLRGIYNRLEADLRRLQAVIANE